MFKRKIKCKKCKKVLSDWEQEMYYSYCEECYGQEFGYRFKIIKVAVKLKENNE